MPVRYKILALLTLVSFTNYALRNNISVALPSIGDTFHFSHAEIGWILGSFNVSYALFQIPGGVFGDRVGSRKALTIIAVSWGILTLLTGFVPHLLAASTGGALAAYMLVRFFMGMTHAPVYPVISQHHRQLVSAWKLGLPECRYPGGTRHRTGRDGPTRDRAHSESRRTRVVLLPRAARLHRRRLVVVLRKRPPNQTQTSERARTEVHRRRPRVARARRIDPHRLEKVILQPDVLILSASYFCMNYVFFIFAQWLFTYLVEARGFSALESGFLYALPFATGAVLALVGGAVSDAGCKRFGSVLGVRVPAMCGLFLVSILLMAGAYAPNPYVAVALLALCFGFTQFADPLYWAAATYIGGPHTASATGAMNTGGNLAGFLAPVVGMVLDNFGWLPTLATGSVFAILAAVLWLFVRAESTSPASNGQLRGQLAQADEL